jgi:hypothetical protein
MEAKKLIYSRSEFYVLVWSEPISKIAKQLNVKESLIRKKCRECNIPTPDSGYWSKLRFQKKVLHTPLPEYQEPNEIVKLFEMDAENKTIPKKNITSKVKTEVPRELINPHLFIKKAKAEHLSNSKKYGSSDGLYGTGMDHLSIQVSPECLNRALLIFDTTIKDLTKKGYLVQIKSHSTVVLVSGIEVPVRLREKTKRVLKKEVRYDWDKYEYKPTGNLVFVVEFKAWHRKEISDTESKKLEERIDQIVEEIIRQGIEEKNYRIQWDIRRKEEKQRLEKEEIRINRINVELDKFKSILINIDRWNRANIFRDYLYKYEQHFSSLNELSSEKLDWLVWARQKVNWFDPFIEEEDELLEGIDRNKLEPITFNKGAW